MRGTPYILTGEVFIPEKLTQTTRAYFATQVDFPYVGFPAGPQRGVRVHTPPQGSPPSEKNVGAHLARKIYTKNHQKSNYPKNPWDVMGCQDHLFGGPGGVMNGGSGVSIGGFRILRVGDIPADAGMLMYHDVP